MMSRKKTISWWTTCCFDLENQRPMTFWHHIAFVGKCDSIDLFNMIYRYCANRLLVIKRTPDATHYIHKQVTFDKRPYVLETSYINASRCPLRSSRYITNNAKAVVLVYSVTDRSSFDAIGQLWKEVNLITYDENLKYHHLHGGPFLMSPLGVDALPFLILGNNADLEKERVVSSEEGRALARRLGVKWGECSATKGWGVLEPMNELVREIDMWEAEEYRQEKEIAKEKAKAKKGWRRVKGFWYLVFGGN